MKETFLHFIWQYQYFDKTNLQTTTGEALHILEIGFPNKNAGTDFLNVKIQIGDVIWVGNIEIHLRSSDWQKHHHQTDERYDKIILHVVWEDDTPIYRKDGELIPTLILKNRADMSYFQKYELITSTDSKIPCAAFLSTVSPLTVVSMLDKTLISRLEKKSDEIIKLYQLNQNNWEETAYQWLAQQFGFKLNNEAFLALAKTIPLKLLQKHRDNVLSMEALLFGASGLIPTENGDEYTALLQKEYKFLQGKYDINNNLLNASSWKFLRLRPTNFPTVRIAQLVSLVHIQENFFAKLIFTKDLADLKAIFQIQPSIYWQQHYSFGKKIANQPHKKLGDTSVDLLLINAVVFLLAAYSRVKNEDKYLEKAITILQALKNEDNYIIREYKNAGLPVRTAYETQALIELHQKYCSEKECLKCNIGASIVRNI
jgi:hypothetical protein